MVGELSLPIVVELSPGCWAAAAERCPSIASKNTSVVSPSLSLIGTWSFMPMLAPFLRQRHACPVPSRRLANSSTIILPVTSAVRIAAGMATSAWTPPPPALVVRGSYVPTVAVVLTTKIRQKEARRPRANKK